MTRVVNLLGPEYIIHLVRPDGVLTRIARGGEFVNTDVFRINGEETAYRIRGRHICIADSEPSTRYDPLSTLRSSDKLFLVTSGKRIVYYRRGSYTTSCPKGFTMNDGRDNVGRYYRAHLDGDLITYVLDEQVVVPDDSSEEEAEMDGGSSDGDIEDPGEAGEIEQDLADISQVVDLTRDEEEELGEYEGFYESSELSGEISDDAPDDPSTDEDYVDL